MPKTKSPASTWGISAPIRKKVRVFVLDMRTTLEEDLRRQLTALGITSNGISEPPKTLTHHDQRLREAAVGVIQQAKSGKGTADEALSHFARESAFTFLNRLIGLRVLEERGLLRVGGRNETVVREDPELRTSSLYFRVRDELPSETSPREVWRETLDRAFRAVSERVGVLFDPDSEFGRYLPLQPSLSKIIRGLNSPDIPPETYVEDELLGWVYQYYNSEEKDEVYAKLGRGGKLDHPKEIAAATCLYTERYMVDFLLQSTLGSLWMSMHPESNLAQDWPFYVTPPVGSEPQDRDELPQKVRDIKVLDPAVGSGHFLMRAFDLLAQMYEEEGVEDPQEVPRLILELNLHGIDIDLRAIQISALGLYLKGCARAGADFRPSRLNLVSADLVLPGAAPESLLDRFADDRDVQDLMKLLWTELKHAPKLGSLLHPERKVEELLQDRRSKGNTLLQQDDEAWERYKVELLEGLREEFEKEAHSEDIAQRLFGANLEKSLSLVEVLTRRYDVVVMNPPYAGSRNLDAVVGEHISREYKEGKRDLYAAFILRCIEFARGGGRVGMVTQHSWMFLRSFAKLRERVLSETSITGLGHLGPRAFEEIGGEVVSVGLFTLSKTVAGKDHRWSAFRLIGPKSPQEKERLLLGAIAGDMEGIQHQPKQSDIKAISETPFVYWLRPRFFELLRTGPQVTDRFDVGWAISSSDNDRFLRFFWEVTGAPFWLNHAKGGSFCRWRGLESWVLDWRDDGKPLKEWILNRYPYLGSNFEIKIRDHRLFKPGWTYSSMSGAGLAFRAISNHWTTNAKSPAVFTGDDLDWSLGAALNSSVSTFLIRSLSSNVNVDEGYVGSLPIPEKSDPHLANISEACYQLKSKLKSRDPCERFFAPTQLEAPSLERLLYQQESLDEAASALLHALEGANEVAIHDEYGLDKQDTESIAQETGRPVGLAQPVSGYASLSDLEGNAELSRLAVDVLESIGQATASDADIQNHKDRLRLLYEAGPGAKIETLERGESQPLSPLPAETFVEELSQKLGLHPITIYCLLEEMRAEEELISAPRMKSGMEDYLSVSLLRILGYRWPEQDAYEEEHGPILPAELVDSDGIVPLVKCNEQPTVFERVRARLEHQFGEAGAQTSEKEFRKWVGKDLDIWLEKEFFKRHISQFKKRPIVWHLTSEEGTFQTFVLYHRLSRETLQRIRTLYAAGMIKRLKGELEQARSRRQDTEVSNLTAQIEDVEDFSDRLRAIEEGSEVEARIRCRWKDEEEEGRLGPYAPDIDDGVKVNVRPFQEMGLLARNVISKW